MPCLFVLATLITPRAAIAVLWFFTNWFHGLFPAPLWPLLGFIFLPTTLLWYSAVLVWFGGQWTLWPVVGIIVALLIDLSPASARRGRQAAG